MSHQQSVRLSIASRASHRDSILSRTNSQRMSTLNKLDPDPKVGSGGGGGGGGDDELEDCGISNYGFGVGFSYHKNYPFYPYIAPKYSNLKEELLQNDIKPVDKETYSQIHKKGLELEIRIQSDDLLGQKFLC